MVRVSADPCSPVARSERVRPVLPVAAGHGGEAEGFPGIGDFNLDDGRTLRPALAVGPEASTDRRSVSATDPFGAGCSWPDAPIRPTSLIICHDLLSRGCDYDAHRVLGILEQGLFGFTRVATADGLGGANGSQLIVNRHGGDRIENAHSLMLPRTRSPSRVRGLEYRDSPVDFSGSAYILQDDLAPRLPLPEKVERGRRLLERVGRTHDRGDGAGFDHRVERVLRLA